MAFCRLFLALSTFTAIQVVGSQTVDVVEDDFRTLPSSQGPRNVRDNAKVIFPDDPGTEITSRGMHQDPGFSFTPHPTTDPQHTEGDARIFNDNDRIIFPDGPRTEITSRGIHQDPGLGFTPRIGLRIDNDKAIFGDATERTKMGDDGFKSASKSTVASTKNTQMTLTELQIQQNSATTSPTVKTELASKATIAVKTSSAIETQNVQSSTETLREASVTLDEREDTNIAVHVARKAVPPDFADKVGHAGGLKGLAASLLDEDLNASSTIEIDQAETSSENPPNKFAQSTSEMPDTYDEISGSGYDSEENDDSEIMEENDDSEMMVLKKCCKRGFYLSDYYRCVPAESTPPFDRKIEKLHSTDSEEIYSQALEHMICPTKWIKEFIPMRIDTINKTIRTRDGAVFNDDYFCLEIVSYLDEISTGYLVLLTCGEQMNKDVTPGHITKCCPLHQVLNMDLDECIDLPYKEELSWVPPRAVLHHGRNLPQGYFILNVTEPPFPCQPKADLADVHNIMDNGKVIVNDWHEDEHNFIVTDYICVDRIWLDKYRTASKVVAVVCTNECRENDICLPKCCGKNEIKSRQISPDEHSSYCVPTSSDYVWDPDNLFRRYLNAVDHTSERPSIMNFEDKDTVIVPSYGSMVMPQPGETCFEMFLSADNPVIISQNHSILISGHGSVLKANFWSYCFDDFSVDGIIKPGLEVCFHNATKIMDWEEHIFDLIHEDEIRWHNIMRGILTFIGIISMIMLIITAVIYITIVGTNSIHSKIVLSNTMSMLFVTLYLVIVFNKKSFHFSVNGCIFLGYFGYFSCMTMLLWMSVMCFDLFYTFLMATKSSRHSDQFKFRVYSIVVWCTSLFFLLIVMIGEGTMDKASKFHPNMKMICFLDDSAMAQVVFFHIPGLTIMTLNLIMFIVTVTIIKKQRDKTSSVRNNSTMMKRRKSDVEKTSKSKFKVFRRVGQDTREQVVLFGKMFFVIGGTWFLEFIHSLVHRNHQDSSMSSSELFFRIVDCLNIGRGVFFFLIFVCKKTMMKKFQKSKAHSLIRSTVSFRAKSQQVEKIKMNITTSTEVTRNSGPDFGRFLHNAASSMPNASNSNDQKRMPNGGSAAKITMAEVNLTNAPDDASRVGVSNQLEPANNQPGEANASRDNQGMEEDAWVGVPSRVDESLDQTSNHTEKDYLTTQF